MLHVFCSSSIVVADYVELWIVCVLDVYSHFVGS